MFFAKFPLTALSCAVLLAGCSAMGGEAYQHSVQRDWNRFWSIDYVDGMRRLTGLDKLAPSQAEREAIAERNVCTHPNGQNRVINANGIHDYASYRRCAATPYPSAIGQRLVGRPNG